MLILSDLERLVANLKWMPTGKQITSQNQDPASCCEFFRCSSECNATQNIPEQCKNHGCSPACLGNRYDPKFDNRTGTKSCPQCQHNPAHTPAQESRSLAYPVSFANNMVFGQACAAECTVTLSLHKECTFVTLDSRCNQHSQLVRL